MGPGIDLAGFAEVKVHLDVRAEVAGVDMQQGQFDVFDVKVENLASDSVDVAEHI